MNSWGFLGFWKEQQLHTKFSFFLFFVTGTSPGGQLCFVIQGLRKATHELFMGEEDLRNLNSSCEFIKDVLKSVTFGKQ